MDQESDAAPDPAAAADPAGAAAASAPAIAATLRQIGPRLRRLRERKDLSLADLSQATGISKSTLSRLESEQRKPSLELLLPIAAALAVPLD
ncbi:helix-turn-helix transcriptional regulator, partial [Streptomyces sp. NRRL S-495]|uniref:helix-turn-helix domain-containing protein n=1 Tax=Streptomyces sp. NRRL S-495 TaxID=1609133 RepID=UPI0005F8A3D9